MSEEGPGSREPDDAGEPTPERPADAARPKAVSTSPAAQVATVAVALVVLLVVGIVFALQDAKEPPQGQPGPIGVTTVPPPAPPSGSASVPGSSDTELLPPDLSVPPSLCPSLTVGHPLTVLAFNIHGGLRGRDLQLDRVATEIKTWKPDVVLLQEVDDHRRRTGFARQAEVLGKLTKMSYVYGPNHNRPDGGPIGNAILTKHKVEEWENILLPRAGGMEQRGLLHAVIDVEGIDISVYSTHFDHRSASARNAQAHAVVAQLKKDGRPTILGGDLNATSRSGPLRTLRQAGGLGDAWAVGEGEGLTAPAGRPRARIDYVLHDAWFTPIQAAVLFSAVSDHRAVWTRLELREEIGCIKVGG